MGFDGFNIFSDIGGNSTYFNSEQLGGLSGAGGGFGVSDPTFFGLKGSNIPQFGKFNYGFIVDTVTNERLAFQYNIALKETGGGEIEHHKCLARSVPQLHYKGGKERTLEMPITFTMTKTDRSDVKKSIRFLQALAYPDYSGKTEIERAPHPVAVVIGDLYSKDLWVVIDFSIEWGDARDPYTQLPSEATITLKLVEVAPTGKSYSEVLQL